MSDTSIEWTDKRWNPVTGCDKISQGCKFCYAEGIANRWAGNKAFPNGFDLTLRPDRLGDPLKWRKPQRVFVNSMSDLFHEGVPADFIKQVWDVMEQTPRHTYQILTKRASRMADLTRLLPLLPNVWLGVSIENRDRKVIERLQHLIDTPAAVRFVSAEPLLGGWPEDLPELAKPGEVNWVIFGGESGAQARPCPPIWIERGIEAARAVGAAPFVKQLGTHWARENRAAHYKGGDINEWPEQLRVREWPAPVSPLEVARG